MRVALDATPLTLSSGGLVRYVSELSVAYARLFPDDDVLLMSDQRFGIPAPAPQNLRRGSGPASVLERRWWLWGLNRALRRERADVLHGTNFAVPFTGHTPSVLSIHDLSPWMDRAWHHAADRVRRHTPWLIRLRRATIILTLTEAVRRQVVEFFRLPPDSVAAVPLAASRSFRPVQSRQNPPPYFLFVGTLEPRKNLPQLLEAWRETRRSHSVDLVLAGRRRADFAELAPEPGLRVLGEVPETDLPALYSQALAFVYPSHYEGFGLPVLEAMQCGAPVIASSDPAIHEVGGDAIVRAGTAAELSRAMIAAAARPDLLAEWRARSLARAGEFSWERTARMTREVYRQAILRHG